MSRTWWVHRLFGRRPSFAARPAAKVVVRPRLVGLEDRTVPANLITIQTGGLAAIPAGASDFGDTADYVIDPAALNTATADVVFRANLSIQFLDTVGLPAGVSLDAEGKGGVLVGAVLTSVDGNIRLVGTAGAESPGILASVGVFVGFDVTAGGNVSITGTGSATLDFSSGVLVFSAVTAAGTVTVTGTGGQGTVGSNDGVNVDFSGSLVAGGDLTVAGVGGGGGFSNGVIAFSTLTSVAGTVRVTGTGGGTGADSIDTGVFLFNTILTAGGPGGVVLDGTGGPGTGGFNDGVLFSTATVTATAGLVTATGRAGGGADSFGVRHSGGTTTAATALTLISDTVDIDPSSTVSALGTLTVRPLTAGRAIDLGGLDSTTALGLTAAELDRLFAAVVVVGDPTAGNLTVTAPVTPAGTSQLELVSGGAITDAAAGTVVTVARLVLTAGTGIGSVGTPFRTAVGTLTATTTGAGGITISEADAVTLTSVTAANGPITITAGGSTTVSSVTSTTDNDANDISIIASVGDLTVATVNAGGTAGDVTLQATTGNIFDDGVNATVITADVLTLTADRAVGAPGATAGLDSTANSLVAATTGAGPFAGAPTPGLWDADTDALAVTSATTQDGVILIDAARTAAGNLTVGTVTAGGTGRIIQLRTSIGATSNIDFGTAGTATAAGDTIRLVSAGAVTESGTAIKVAAANLSLVTVAGTASVADPLNTAVSTLAFQNSTAGEVGIRNTGALTLTTVGTVTPSFNTAAAQTTAVSAASPLTIAVNVTSAGDLILTAGDSAAVGDDLTVLAGVTVRSTGGNVFLNAGDQLLLDPASLIKSDVGSINLAVDANDADPGVGATLSVPNTLSAAVGINVFGGPDADTFTFAAAQTVPTSLTSNAGVDTVNVTKTGVTGPLTINTGSELDVVNIGNTGTVGSPGLLTPIAGTVTVDGGAGGATLTVDGSGAGVAANYAVSDAAVTRSLPAGFGGVTYSNLATLLLTVGAGANVVDVTNTAVPTTVNTNAGIDTVNVLKTAVAGPLSINTGSEQDAVFIGTANTTTNPGLLTPVAGAVTVDGGADGATLTVDGSGAGVAANYAISSTTVTRSLPAGFGGVTYSNTTSLLLTVGAGANVIDVTGTSVPTTVNTNAGADTVNVTGAGLAAALTVNTGTEDDAVTLIGTPAFAVTVDGGAGTDTLTGPDGGATFTVTALNAGGVAGASFSNVENLTGGTGNDTFAFANGAGVSGLVNGGTGTDALDYSAYTTGVRVNLGANAPGFAATLEGSQEVPPQTGTTATGTASLTYNVATGLFDIAVAVTNLAPAAVTGYHIHRAPFGVNGPIVVDLAALFGLGALVSDGAGGFTFTATGVSLPAINEAALLGGITYFNVHTAAAPGGLIRGQLFPTAAFVNVAGVATGTGGVTNIENATGGSAADSLVGSNLANVLSGLDGNDTLVGAKGNDSVSGGAANDVLVWSNGDNNDVLNGDAGTDLVQVNGAVAAGDVFTVGPNGTRVAFARTNLVPFALDIGTVETLTVNGIGGDDTFTAKNLAGVADLTQLNLNGLDGNDTFTVAASPTVSVRVNGGSPVLPATPGDKLVLDAENNPLALVVPGSDLSAGTFTVPGRKAVDYVSVETIDAINVTLTLIPGTNGDDTVVLYKNAPNKLVYTFNGGPEIPVFGPAVQFDGLNGRDRLFVDYKGGDPLAGLNASAVFFDGTNKAQDTLIVDGRAKGFDATYLPDAAETGKGLVTVFATGTTTADATARRIAFRNLSPADLTGLGTATLVLPGADDQLTLTTGKDFGTGLADALRVSGSSGGVAIEPVAFWNNAKVLIDTAAAPGTDGNDTITLDRADNAHLNLDLAVVTGKGTDTVTVGVTAGVVVAGNFSVQSVDVAVNKDVTAGAVTLSNSGPLILSKVTVSGATGVTQTGVGPVLLAGDATLTSAAGNVSIGSAVDSKSAGANTLTVSALAGTVTLSKSVGAASRPLGLAVTGKAISLAGASYNTTGDQTYTGLTTVSAPAVGFDSTAGKVTFAGTLNPAVSDATDVTAATANGLVFQGAVGAGVPLKSLTVTKGATAADGGQVFTVRDQLYAGPVTAANDIEFRSVTAAGFPTVGTGNLTFQNSLTAVGKNVTVCTNSPGVISFFGAVTAASLSLPCTGVADLNGGTVDTGAGPQTYAGDVILSADATLTASVVTFGGRVDADAKSNWALNVVANATFGGAVGGADSAGIPGRSPLGRLDVSGAATVAGSLIRTTNVPLFVLTSSQNFVGPVTVTADTVFVSAGTGIGPISFFSSLDSGPAGFAVRVTTAGPTTFGGSVGQTNPLGELTTDGGGTTIVRGGQVRTTSATGRSGSQLYRDAVQAGFVAATFGAAGPTGPRSVLFDSTLDGIGGGTPEVVVQTVGDVTFNAPVGGTVRLGSLLVFGNGDPTAAGPISINGGFVTTDRYQEYGGRVVLGKNATLTAGDTVTFADRLDAAAAGGSALVVNSPGRTRFAGPVGGVAPLAALTTDAAGSVQFAGGLVRTAAAQTYNDPATVTVDTDFRGEDAGAALTFASTLDGPAAVFLTSPGPIALQGAVGGTTRVRSFQASSGPVAVNGGLVRADGFITFGSPVTVARDTDFIVLSPPAVGTLGDAAFNGTLTGLGKAVRVFASGSTSFRGDVAVGSLTTDLAGRTAIDTAAVTATGAVDFADPVFSSTPAVTVGGGSVRFRQTLTGIGTDLAVNSSGVARFDGEVRLKSLATDAPGTTQINAAGVSTGGSQTYGDPVTVGSNITFSAGTSATFQQTLTGPTDVGVNAADTVFNGGVDVGSLTTDAAGTTQVNGGGVTTARFQRYDDPVTVGKQAAVFQDGGTGVAFNSTLDGGQPVRITTAGDTLLGARVGGVTPLASLTLDGGGTSTVAGGLVATTGAQTFDDRLTATAAGGSKFVSAANVVVNNDLTNTAGRLDFAAGTGVAQTAGKLAAADLNLTGGGKFDLDQTDNTVSLVSVAVGTGTVFLSTDLPLGLNGPVSGDTVRLRTDRDFASNKQPINTTGLFIAYLGLDGKPANATFDSAAVASAVVLGQPDLAKDNLFGLALPPETKYANTQNVGNNQFTVSFPKGTPVFVYGNDPRTPPGDGLLPNLTGLTVLDFQYDGQNGFYVVRFADGTTNKLTFQSIEGLSGLSAAAFAVQTGEPRDGSGVTSQQYNVRVTRTQNGTVLPGGLTGARLPENPFVVSPALVNPAAPTQSPRIAFGDFNGDNVPDLVLANGPGTPPLVTVIDGRALNQSRDAAGNLRFDAAGQPVLNQIADLQRNGLVLAQFYAYDPGFQGGVNVAVGRLGRNGGLTITTGADEGGGPHVRTFELVPAVAGSATSLAPRQLATSLGNFFAYESSFTGGVRVAVADVTGDGTDDLILAAGAGGGPRVRVFAGEDWGGKTVELTGTTQAFADFFTVEDTFRGGLYVAAGKYQPNSGKADIIVGAASGGGPRVMVFDGTGLTRGTTPPPVMANFFAFSAAELNDPLFGEAGFATGVGGVSFGARGASGYLDVLVSTGRGPQVKVRQFPGGTGELNRDTALDLTDPTLDSRLTQPLKIPGLVDGTGAILDPKRVNYGATVGGFDVT